ncbi:MAG: histone deacetylase, partial [Opitutae bacterium]|nr:histone deacetylase [Opitutae bacterium]
MTTFSLYYHPLYSDGLDRTARFPVDRYRLLAEKISLLNSENNIRITEPRLATRDELLLVHEESFIDRFIEGNL